MLRNSRYWHNKKIPLLINIHNSFESISLHSTNKLEMYSLETWVSNINLHQVIRDSIPRVDRPKHSYINQHLKNICTLFIEQEYENWYKVFTDGSKDKTGGGAAFLDPYSECSMKFKIDSDISIMHIELIAISEALSYIDSISFGQFVILTDSKSSLQHLARCASQVRGEPIAYDIIKSILKLQSQNKKVIIQWLPSHIQIRGNEAVDLLAKQAVEDGIPLIVLPLFSDHIKHVKNHCRALWQEHFDVRSREKGIWYRTIQPQITCNSWIDNSPLNRNFIRSIIRLRSGHIPSNKFALFMKNVPSPKCDVCRIVEDVQHILKKCVRNEAIRILYFDSDKNFHIGTMNSILAYPMSEEAKMLVKLADLILCKE